MVREKEVENVNYIDITKNFAKNNKSNSHKILDKNYFKDSKGFKYKVDGKNVVLDYSKKRNLAGRFQARQNAHCVRAEYPVRKIQMPSGVPSPALPSDPRLRNRLQLRFLFA